MLWQSSLVMYDVETGSLWSHLLGEAMSGPLKGAVLEQLPSVMTDWATWKAKHPQTTVINLSRTSREYRRSFYRDPAQFVLGIADGEAALAWRFDLLQRAVVWNDTWDGTPVVVFFDAGNSTARLFDRRLGGRTLVFEWQDARIRDRQTRSVWDGVTGRATDGLLAEKHLKPLTAIVSYTRAWKVFHPTTTIRRP